MARRISGSEGCGGGPLGASFFPPTRSLQAPVLQISKRDAGHQRMPMQTGPGPALEVAKAEFLFELLMDPHQSPHFSIVGTGAESAGFVGVSAQSGLEHRGGQGG